MWTMGGLGRAIFRGWVGSCHTADLWPYAYDAMHETAGMLRFTAWLELVQYTMSSTLLNAVLSDYQPLNKCN